MALTANQLSEDLGISLQQKLESEKTLTVKLTPGKKPEVTFSGFWTGKFIQAAMNSIARAYRVRRLRAKPQAIVGEQKPQLIAEKKEA